MSNPNHFSKSIRSTFNYFVGAQCLRPQLGQTQSAPTFEKILGRGVLISSRSDQISQVEALTEIGLHLNHEFFGGKSLFYYFLTVNNIFEQALHLSF